MAAYSPLICVLIGCLLASVEGGPFKCQEEGRFPHPHDCSSYVDCFLGSDGEMITQVGDCFGFPYHPEKKLCVSHEEMPYCKLDSKLDNKLSNFVVPALNYHCVDDPSKRGCEHCYLGYNCIDGEAYVNICEKETSCSEEDPFEGSCLPENTPTYTAQDCACNKNGVYGDNYNQTYYHYCNTLQNDRNTYMCESGTEFDDITFECKIEPTTTTLAPPTIPPCTGTGAFVNPDNCQYFYTCLPGGDALSGYCADGQYFDEVNDNCIEACGLVTSPTDPNTVCPASYTGYVADSSDCKQYYLCIDGNLIDTLTCPANTYFDLQNGLCVSGSPPGTPKCASFDYSSCPGATTLDCTTTTTTTATATTTTTTATATTTTTTATATT